MNITEWISGRRKLLDAATEGPWFQGREGHRYESAREVYSKREPDEDDSHDIANYVWSAEDAALIADARTSLPAALDTLEAVLELHYPYTVPCQLHHDDPADTCPGYWTECAACAEKCPCPTIMAVEAALGVKEAP